MRALIVLLLLAACAEPEAAPRPTWGQDDATADPTRNIEAIGAHAMCRDDERPVITHEGATVTACEAAGPPVRPAPAE